MQTIGERLEEARKKKSITIREASEATKIRGDYLQKFESNQFDIGLTELYTRGFLRTYALFLKLPADRILSDYAALGHGSSRARPSSREIYGRLDVASSAVSAATPDSPASTAAAPEAAADKQEAAPSARGTPRSRSGNIMPTGIDPVLIFKYGKWALIGVVVLVLVFSIKALFSGGKPAAPSPSTPSASAPRGHVLGLVATSSVQVTVRKKNTDGSEGEVLYTGLMNAGETRTVPRPGELFIEASTAENLQIEISGKRYSLGQLLGNGYQRGQLPAPSP